MIFSLLAISCYPILCVSVRKRIQSTSSRFFSNYKVFWGGPCLIIPRSIAKNCNAVTHTHIQVLKINLAILALTSCMGVSPEYTWKKSLLIPAEKYKPWNESSWYTHWIFFFFQLFVLCCCCCRCRKVVNRCLVFFFFLPQTLAHLVLLVRQRGKYPAVIGTIWPNSNCLNRTVKNNNPKPKPPFLPYFLLSHSPFLFPSGFHDDSSITLGIMMFVPQQFFESSARHSSSSSCVCALSLFDAVLCTRRCKFTVTFPQESPAYKMPLIINFLFGGVCARPFWLFQDQG